MNYEDWREGYECTMSNIYSSSYEDLKIYIDQMEKYYLKMIKELDLDSRRTKELLKMCCDRSLYERILVDRIFKNETV